MKLLSGRLTFDKIVEVLTKKNLVIEREIVLMDN
jgi:hypothetical protein